MYKYNLNNAELYLYEELNTINKKFGEEFLLNLCIFPKKHLIKSYSFEELCNNIFIDTGSILHNTSVLNTAHNSRDTNNSSANNSRDTNNSSANNSRDTNNSSTNNSSKNNSPYGNNSPIKNNSHLNNSFEEDSISENNNSRMNSFDGNNNSHMNSFDGNNSPIKNNSYLNNSFEEDSISENNNSRVNCFDGNNNYHINSIDENFNHICDNNSNKYIKKIYVNIKKSISEQNLEIINNIIYECDENEICKDTKESDIVNKKSKKNIIHRHNHDVSLKQLNEDIYKYKYLYYTDNSYKIPKYISKLLNVIYDI